MPRKPTGKPLTLFPIRVDDDVKEAILALKEEHKTINEGLRSLLLVPKAVFDPNEPALIRFEPWRSKGPLLKPSEKK